MRTCRVAALVAALVAVPALSAAQPADRAADGRSAPRWIGEATERISATGQPVTVRIRERRSQGTSVAHKLRILLGLTLIGGGAGLLMLDPRQPTQPKLVSPNDVARTFNAERSRVLGLLAGPPYRHTNSAWDRVLMDNYRTGGEDGVYLGSLAMRDILWRDGRELYDGPLQPARIRRPEVKVGGAAAIAAGALLLMLRGGGDEESNESRRFQITAGPGRVTVSTAVGF